MMSRLLQFNPNKRPTAEQCLLHPYLAQFHNPSEEPSCEKKIMVEINDNVKYGYGGGGNGNAEGKKRWCMQIYMRNLLK
jgi:serine/threonine protein kinase